MDILFQKAKVFAQETAKKSQEIALEAAKFSQEIALETAKRSKEIAMEATKKADELKKMAGELPPSIASAASKMAGELSSSPSPVTPPTDAELQEFGITSDLREFVRGLTINTFKEFPLAEYDAKQQIEGVDVAITTRQDLPEWQERHAVLVLASVPEMSDFRYVLCPRRMKESRFWRIYFILVKNLVAPYEAKYLERTAAAKLAKEEEERKAEKALAVADKGVSKTTAVQDNSISVEVDKPVASKAVGERSADQELDAYLLGADSGDEGHDADDDPDFDDDFDKALDSDGEDDTANQGHPSNTTDKLQNLPKEASENSSDGELVEIPETESPTKLESQNPALL